MRQGGACQPTDSCWLVGSEILKASRVSMHAVKQRCMPRRQACSGISTARALGRFQASF